MIRKLRRKPIQEQKTDLAAMPTDGGTGRKAALAAMAGAFQLSAHVLTKHADQLTGQMVGRLSGIKSPAVQSIVQRGIARKKSPWLRLLEPSLTPPGEPLLRTLSGHKGWVRRVAISPEGKFIVSGSSDRTIKVWNLTSGKELRSIEILTESDYLEAGKLIDSVTVTPRGAQVVNGARIVTRAGGVTRFWDLDSGLEDTTIGSQTIMKLKEDGTLALLKGKGQYHVWDLVCNHKLVTLQQDGIERIRVNPHWTHALVKVKGAYHVWDLGLNKKLSVLKEEIVADAITTITPYGIFMAKQKGKMIEIWDLKRGRKRCTLDGHSGKIVDHHITGIAVTPDGSRVISCSYDSTIKVLDLRRDKELFTLEGSDGSVAVTPDGAHILNWSLGSDTIKIWDLEVGKEIHTLTGHAGGVSGCAISLDGPRLVSAGYDGTLKVWDLTNLEAQQTHFRYAGGVRGLAITPDGTGVISGNRDGTLKVWDLARRQELFSLECQDKLNSVAVTPDGTRVVAGLWEAIEIWDLNNRQKLRTFKWGEDGLAPQDYTGKIAITPDGTRLLACCGSTIHIWDLDRDTKIGILGKHGSGVNDLVVTPDGSRLIFCSRDSTLQIWDLALGKEIRRLNWYGAITALAITPDVTRAITGGGTPDRSDGKGDYIIRVLNLQTGEQISTLEGHTSGITDITVTPDGSRVVSSSEDNTLRVWDLDSGAEIARFSGEGSMYACAVAPDGSCYITGDAAGRLHFLQLENVPPGVPASR